MLCVENAHVALKTEEKKENFSEVYLFMQKS